MRRSTIFHANKRKNSYTKTQRKVGKSHLRGAKLYATSGSGDSAVIADCILLKILKTFALPIKSN